MSASSVVSKSTPGSTKVLNRCELQEECTHKAYIVGDGQHHGKWFPYLLNKEIAERHHLLLTKARGSTPDPTPAGLDTRGIGTRKIRCTKAQDGSTRRGRCPDH